MHPVGKKDKEYMDILEGIRIPGSNQDMGLEGIQKGISFLGSTQDME